MATYPNEYKITSATGKLSPFNLSKSVITTQNFGYLLPIECKFLIPGDKFNINVNQFLRLMPLPCPTYGKIDVITRAFFVPFRYLIPHWNEFISNNKYTNQAGTLVSPYVNRTTMDNVMNALISLMHETSATGEYDLVVHPQGAAIRYYSHTSSSRLSVTFLHNIGLPIPLEYYAGRSAHEVSILPLLGFWKFYLDWICPSRWLHQWTSVTKLLSASYLESHLVFNASDIQTLITIPPTFVEDDFFVSAFQNPDGAEVQQATDYIIENQSYSMDPALINVQTNSAAFSIKENTGAIAATQNGEINRFTLKSIGVLQDLINRGKLAGTKVQDYLVAEYGLRPSDDALQLSKYLGSFRDTIQIGDVTAMAESETSSGGTTYLGAFAGKALGQCNGHFSYETSDHGLLFITSELQVKQSYVQGIRPEMQLIERNDFYQPEFDNLGVEPITTSQINTFDMPFDSVFGFTPTYSKLKTNFDTVSGDFIVPTLGGGIDGHLSSWYLSRLFDNAEMQDLYVSMSFQQANNFGNGSNYDRIFQVEEGDHFYSIFHLDIKAMRPMIPIADALETEETNRGSEKKIDFQNTMH